MSRIINVPDEEFAKELSIAFDMSRELPYRVLGAEKAEDGITKATQILNSQIRDLASKLTDEIEKQNKEISSWLRDNWQDTLAEAKSRGAKNPELVTKSIAAMHAIETSKLLTNALRTVTLVSMIRETKIHDTCDAKVQQLMLQGGIESMFSDQEKQHFTEAFLRTLSELLK